MQCPIPSDMGCPIPLILWGETWDVLCRAIARESRMVQVYFSAVMLLIARTNAIGGNVEGRYFGVCLRYTARCGAGWAGRHEGAGRMGGGRGEAGKGGTPWCAWGAGGEMIRRRGSVMADRIGALLRPHRRRDTHSGPTPPVSPPPSRWQTYRDPVEHPLSKIF